MMLPSACRDVALFAPARHTVLSGCSAPVPPKIFLPLTDGAEYLMVMFLPPRVAEVSMAGLAGGAFGAFFLGASWAEARPATTASARTPLSARVIFILVLRFLSSVSILPLALHHYLGHVNTVFPIALLRVFLGLIGLGSAFMAGSTLAAGRKRRLNGGRHYAWMWRAVFCLAALAFRPSPDAVLIGAWALSAAAFGGGWWQGTHQKPPEDLSHEIVPRDE